MVSTKYILLSFGGLSAFGGAVAVVDHSEPIWNRTESPDIHDIMARDPSTFASYPASAVLRGGNSGPAAHWSCNWHPQRSWEDRDATAAEEMEGMGGIYITNADPAGYRAFYIYHNNCDAVPYTHGWVAPGETQFVLLPPRFEGRITRGVDVWNLAGRPQTLASWLEFSLDAQGWIWADLSLIRGCDGATVLWATDGSGAWKGFAHPIFDGAPLEAYAFKDSGSRVLDASVDWDGIVNTPVRDWELSQVNPGNVYVDDQHGNPVITSTNGLLATYWPAGRP